MRAERLCSAGYLRFPGGDDDHACLSSVSIFWQKTARSSFSQDRGRIVREGISYRRLASRSSAFCNLMLKT